MDLPSDSDSGTWFEIKKTQKGFSQKYIQKTSKN